MNLRNLQLTAILFLLIFSSVMYGQNIVPITVTQVANTATDTFGVCNEATYCTDAALGESELPPKPPTGVFDIRFVDHRDPTCLGQGQRLHLQACSTTEADTFQLSFQKGDGAYSFVVSWPAGLSSSWSSLIITDALGLGFVNVDMLTNTSTPAITQSFITALNIIGTPSACVNCLTSVDREVNNVLPTRFALNQNYPNPFNPSTTIKFSIEKTAFADIAVFDVLGRRIATLAAEELNPGFYTTTWNGTDHNGVAVSSGVYYVRMVATGGQNVNFSAVQKLLLMK